MLAKREHAAGEISQEFSITPQAVSQHLNALKEAGLVRVRSEGTKRVYAIDARGFAEIDHWLAHVRSFWSGRLDDLEAQYLAHRKRKRRRSAK